MQKYNAGDKFVIEIEEVFTGDLLRNKPIEERYRIRGFNTLMFDSNGLDKLERLDSDYVNENFGELQDESYLAGFSAGRESGIADGKVLALEAIHKELLQKEIKVGDVVATMDMDCKAVVIDQYA